MIVRKNMNKNRTVLFGLFLVLCQPLLVGQSNNACNAKELANAERRICYARAQSKLTAEVERVITDQVAEFKRALRIWNQNRRLLPTHFEWQPLI